jgi:hypothetical protein
MIALFSLLIFHCFIQLGLIIDYFQHESGTWLRAQHHYGGTTVIVLLFVFFIFDAIALSLIGQLLYFHIGLQRMQLSTYQYIVRDHERKRNQQRRDGELLAARTRRMHQAKQEGNHVLAWRLQCGGTCRAMGISSCDPLELPPVELSDEDPETGFAAALGDGPETSRPEAAATIEQADETVETEHVGALELAMTHYKGSKILETEDEALGVTFIKVKDESAPTKGNDDESAPTTRNEASEVTFIDVNDESAPTTGNEAYGETFVKTSEDDNGDPVGYYNDAPVEVELLNKKYESLPDQDDAITRTGTQTLNVGAAEPKISLEELAPDDESATATGRIITESLDAQADESYVDVDSESDLGEFVDAIRQSPCAHADESYVKPESDVNPYINTPLLDETNALLNNESSLLEAEFESDVNASFDTPLLEVTNVTLNTASSQQDGNAVHSTHTMADANTSLSTPLPEVNMSLDTSTLADAYTSLDTPSMAEANTSLDTPSLTEVNMSLDTSTLADANMSLDTPSLAEANTSLDRSSLAEASMLVDTSSLVANTSLDTPALVDADTSLNALSLSDTYSTTHNSLTGASSEPLATSTDDAMEQSDTESVADLPPLTPTRPAKKKERLLDQKTPFDADSADEETPFDEM